MFKKVGLAVFSNPESSEDDILKANESFEVSEDNIKEKVSNVVKFIKNIEFEVAKIEGEKQGFLNEVKRLNDLQDSKERFIESLNKRIKTALESLDIDKLDLEIFKLSFRKSESTETKDLEKILKEKLVQQFANNSLNREDLIKELEQAPNYNEFKEFIPFVDLDVSLSVSKSKVKAFLTKSNTFDETVTENKIEGCFIDKKKKLVIK